jgi:hypothetical protein
MKKTSKTFDCVEMKRRAQGQIRAAVAGMSREEEIAFFREGAEEFQERINRAKASLKQASANE